MKEGPSEVDDAQMDLETAGAPLPELTMTAFPAVAEARSPGLAPGVAREPEAEPGGSDTVTKPLPRPAGRRAHHRRSRYHWLVSWAVVLVVAGGFAVGLRVFVVQTFFVPTGSMIPNLLPYDRILVLKVGYTIDRGSILVFRRPPHDTDDPNSEDLVKRVIGLPGETIWSRGNTIYIDGKPLSQPWLPKGTILGQPIREEKIPAGDYFMMGDNRSVSYDSRDWGVLPRSYIIGKVILVIWRHGAPAFHLR
jgi:signal peptidase I